MEASTRMSGALRVESVSLAFGGVRALSGVSFEAAEGAITAVIGPNGAGKTSLFNAISGFYRPNTGHILFDGKDITALRPPARAKLGLARTFQNIALFRGMTVLDNIKLGRHAHLRTNVFDALLYWGRAQREEIELRREVIFLDLLPGTHRSEIVQVVDFLWIVHRIHPGDERLLCRGRRQADPRYAPPREPRPRDRPQGQGRQPSAPRA